MFSEIVPKWNHDADGKVHEGADFKTHLDDKRILLTPDLSVLMTQQKSYNAD